MEVYVRPIYNINRFVLQQLGDFVECVWLWRISGGVQSHYWVRDWPFSL